MSLFIIATGEIMQINPAHYFASRYRGDPQFLLNSAFISDRRERPVMSMS
jgi:hypothetical protein